MAQLLVRNIDATVKQRLKRRAAKHGHSLEQEVRDILQRAVGGGEAPREGLGTFIARHLTGKELDVTIPEWRGEEPRPAKFGR
jgi:antitoxin FitA